MSDQLEAHPAAAAFPMMESLELAQLAADIKEHGLREPIVRVRDGKGWKILDGRNRLRACKFADVAPRFEDYEGDDPIAFVISENIRRRHLNPTQRAAIGVDLIPLYEAEAKERQIRKPIGSASANLREQNGKAAEKAAAAVSVSPRTLEHGLQVVKNGSAETVHAFRTGQLAVSAASDLAKLPKADQRVVLDRAKLEEGKEVRPGLVRAYAKQAQRAITAERINAEPTPMPAGPFRVIVSDPPWNYGKRVGDATHRGDLPYPSMPTESICELPVGSIAHPDGCILWLWTTNAFMRDAYDVLDAWGFEEKTILTWAKNRIGLGDWLRGQTEHCILAVRGKPTITLTNETTLLNGPVREHSRKPDEFYELVEKLCPGSKVEMFCRQPREGWARWGAESELFNV